MKRLILLIITAGLISGCAGTNQQTALRSNYDQCTTKWAETAFENLQYQMVNKQVVDDYNGLIAVLQQYQIAVTQLQDIILDQKHCSGYKEEVAQ